MRYNNPPVITIEVAEDGFVANCDRISVKGPRLQDALGNILISVLRPSRIAMLSVTESEKGGWLVLAPSDAGSAYDTTPWSAVALYCLFVGMGEDADIFDIDKIILPNGIEIVSHLEMSLCDWLDEFVELDSKEQLTKALEVVPSDAEEIAD
ncbi:MAG TPA: hypothetical protein V6D29_25940 [Leptolyngbyaceae cyanobacterium]